MVTYKVRNIIKFWVPVQWIQRGSFPEIKRPEREACDSLPYNAEVKNDGALPLFSDTPSWHVAKLCTGIILIICIIQVLLRIFIEYYNLHEINLRQ
jgi:hypothetical protein